VETKIKATYLYEHWYWPFQKIILTCLMYSPMLSMLYNYPNYTINNLAQILQ